MWNHPAEDKLIDVMDGVAGERVRQHVASCSHCTARVAQASEGLRRSLEADVPEPSPLYWEAFRRQVGHRIDRPEPLLQRWHFGSVLAAAAAVVAVVGFLGPALPLREPPSVATIPAWSALPSADEDGGLAVLRAAAPIADDFRAVAECRGVSECMASLSEDESRALVDAMKQQLPRSDS